MSVLADNQAAKSQRPAEQLNVRPVKPGLIANQPLIHSPFEPCSEYWIEQVRRDEYGDYQHGERRNHPACYARAPAYGRGGWLLC